MDDHFDIRTLPSNFVPQSHPSQIIERLNEKRRKAHHAVIEEIEAGKTEINLQIEEEIISKSNELKTRLKQKRENTDYLLFMVQHIHENEFETIKASYVQDVVRKISESNESRKATVDDLYDSLVETERKRSQKMKLLLNESYSKLLDISYKLPFDVEEFFDKEILRINQVTLNNYQHYVELQTELKLQIENDMRLWMQKLYEVKEKFQKHLKDVASQQEEESQIQSAYGSMDKRFSRMNRRLSEYDAVRMVLEFKLSQLYIQLDLKNIDIWLKDIQMTMACFDRSAKYVVGIYKAAIVVIFHRFFKELEEIKKSMLDLDLLSKDELGLYECEIYTPTAAELDLKTEEEFDNIKDIWGKLMTYIENSLTETYLFVKKATYLWDHHFERMDEAQELVLEDVTNTTAKNINMEQNAECKLNILLDKLRQSPNEKKLEKNFKVVKNKLDNLESLYRSHNIEEQKVLDKYRDLVDIEIDVLLAEIKRFLFLHPPNEEMDPKKQRKRASQDSQIFEDPNEKYIPPQMLFCRYEVIAVSNWMFGLWEAINQYLESGRAEIMVKAQEWIGTQKEKINGRLDVKLSFFKMRHERIEHAIYKKRLEELIRHSMRFKRHQMAINLEIKSLSEIKELNQKKYDEISNEFSMKREKILSNILHSSRSSQVRRHKESLLAAAAETMNSIDKILDESNNACTLLERAIKFSNFKYKKAIRLFSENGNFNPEEATTFIKNLNKLVVTGIKSLNSMKKDNYTKHNNFKLKLQARKSEAETSMQEMILEYEHNEKTVEQIFSLQNEICKLVIDLKGPAMKQKNIINNLVATSGEELGRSDYLDTFDMKIDEMSEEINIYSPFLLHPEPVVLYSTASTATSHEKMDFEDFTSELFPVKPNESDECFVSKLNCSIYKSFLKVQEAAKNFYSTHQKILLSYPQIQPTYEKFMKEILQKYRTFVLQGEICWLENASCFLNSLDHFTNFKNEYILSFENKFYGFSHNRIEDFKNDMMKNLRNDKQKLDDTFNALHSKLKTLHGHPNNRGLLESLKQEFEATIKETGKNLDNYLHPKKAALLELFEEIKNAYKITKNKLDGLYQKNTTVNVKNVLGEQFHTKLHLMRKVVKDMKKPSITSIAKKDDNSSGIGGQIVTYLRDKGGALDTYSETGGILSLIDQAWEELSQRNFIEELQNNFTNYDNTLTNFVEKKMIKLHTDFQHTWANDVEKVINLYSVKYDIKNI